MRASRSTATGGHRPVPEPSQRSRRPGAAMSLLLEGGGPHGLGQHGVGAVRRPSVHARAPMRRQQHDPHGARHARAPRARRPAGRARAARSTTTRSSVAALVLELPRRARDAPAAARRHHPRRFELRGEDPRTPSRCATHQEPAPGQAAGTRRRGSRRRALQARGEPERAALRRARCRRRSRRPSAPTSWLRDGEAEARCRRTRAWSRRRPG